MLKLKAAIIALSANLYSFLSNLEFVFICVWQTSLKALSGAVSCIDMVHHKSLLSLVSS